MQLIHFLFTLTLIALGYFITCAIIDSIFLNKELKKDKKRQELYNLGMEEYYFTLTEDYEIAESNIASLCNELGIVLQSDIENDSEEYYW